MAVFIVVHDTVRDFTINVDHIVFIDRRILRPGSRYNAEIFFVGPDNTTKGFPQRIAVLETVEEIREMIDAERELIRSLHPETTKP